MKKKTYRKIIGLAFIGLSLLISCSGEPKSPEGTASVKFGSVVKDSTETRTLTQNYTIQELSNLYWYFTAEKTDGTWKSNTYYKIGGEDEKGINGKSSSQKFTAGKYKFTVYGYTTNQSGEENASNLIYKGTSEEYTITADYESSIAVTVCSVKEKGKLMLSDLKFSCSNITSFDPELTVKISNNSRAEYTLKTNKKNCTGTFSKGGVTWTLGIVKDETMSQLEWDGNYPILPAGTYTVTFEGSDEFSLSGSELIEVKIAGNCITKIGGNLTGSKIYEVGKKGQAGYIFGSYTEDGKTYYLEAATEDLSDTTYYGYYKENSNITTAEATGSEVGKGYTNTKTLTSKSGTWVSDPEEDDAVDSYAAKKASEYSKDSFSDWFLPSSDELSAMYTNLASKGIGNFESGSYWSSTEKDAKKAVAVNFGDSGKTEDTERSTSLNVRAVRRFEVSSEDVATEPAEASGDTLSYSLETRNE